MPATISVRILDTLDTTTVVGILRSIRSMPVAALVASIRGGLPIEIGTLFDREHEDHEKEILTILTAFDTSGVQFELAIDGKAEPRQVLHNRIQRYRQISYDVQMETELEIGEPSAEAAQWATGKFQYPK